jgi:hypothetical protein
LRLNGQIELRQLAVAAVDLVIHARFTQLLETLVFDRFEGKSALHQLAPQLVTCGFQPGNDGLDVFMGIGPWQYLGFEATRQKSANLVPDLPVAHGLIS